MVMIWERVRRVMSSKAHARVDRMEHPEEMLDQLVRERVAAIEGARRALNHARAFRVQLEERIGEEESRIQRMQTIAQTALADDSEEAARQAISRKQTAANHRDELKQQLARTEKLAAGHRKVLDRMEQDLEQLRDKRRLLKQRIWLSRGMSGLALSNQVVSEPVNEVLARIEERTIIAESEVTAVLDPEEETGDQLENYMQNYNVDQELAEMKAALSRSE
ncbi:MAG: PspA/IM30 family protein [Acidobacteriota bacterium]|nr:PspA/IM30 family protein [Acidobacteriota bacterium]